MIFQLPLFDSGMLCVSLKNQMESLAISSGAVSVEGSQFLKNTVVRKSKSSGFALILKILRGVIVF